uniref:SXP/RAL-2 family protein Ani s 5-like cation-binding domain-containing protein n=1 Tax=Caenorhabditis japonica TaxID=281687 RepID=A0A8R1DSQ4_CAEJA
MLSLPLISLLFLSSATSAFRGLPSLPGYLNAFGDGPSRSGSSSLSSSSEDRGEQGLYYTRGSRVNVYPRVYNGLEVLGDEKEKDPVLAQIRQNVESDIKQISDEVGLVSKLISAIYNNQSISVEARNNEIQVLHERHPKIVPAILNLIGKLHQWRFSG